MHNIHPVVNNNGSKRAVLVDRHMTVREALDRVTIAMQEALPHGRDYQTGGDYVRDRAEAEQRLLIIREYSDQYYKEAVMLANEEGQHEPRT